jgi:serine/threonine-protein kinase
VKDAFEPTRPIKRVGRYAVFEQIAAGGMATVHLARLAGPVGFRRVVAVKALHPHLYQDPEFKEMLIEEARLAARVRHPNVVPTLDIVATDSELFIVMDYVEGESLSTLRKAARRQDGSIPPAICAAIMSGVLHGLHAAHEATSEKGEPLHIVHRDVSPQNILVGVDGVARVLDFGVAKALQGRQETRAGQVKGKSSYMAPEQIRGETLTRRVDVFAAAVVFWELLTARRLFGGRTDEERVYKVLNVDPPPPSEFCPEISAAVDETVLKGLRSNADERYETARDMAEAIEASMTLASQRVVGEWVSRVGAQSLSGRSETVRQIETTRLTSLPPPRNEAASADGRPRDEESMPSVPSTRAEGVKSPSEMPWWRRRRSLVAALAVALVGVLTLAVGARIRAGRTAPSTSANGTASEPTLALTAQSFAASSAVAEPEIAEPSPPSAASPAPSPEASGRKGTAVRRAGSANRPPTKLSGPRAFRPTEL